MATQPPTFETTLTIERVHVGEQGGCVIVGVAMTGQPIRRLHIPVPLDHICLENRQTALLKGN